MGPCLPRGAGGHSPGAGHVVVCPGSVRSAASDALKPGCSAHSGLSLSWVLDHSQFQGDPSTAHPGVAHRLITGARRQGVRKTSLTWALPDEVLRMQATAKNRFSLLRPDIVKKPSLPQTLEPVQEGLGSRAVPSPRAGTTTPSHQPTPQGNSRPDSPVPFLAGVGPALASRRRGPPARAAAGGRPWGLARAHSRGACAVGSA